MGSLQLEMCVFALHSGQVPGYLFFEVKQRSLLRHWITAVVPSDRQQLLFIFAMVVVLFLARSDLVRIAGVPIRVKGVVLAQGGEKAVLRVIFLIGFVPPGSLALDFRLILINRVEVAAAPNIAHNVVEVRQSHLALQAHIAAVLLPSDLKLVDLLSHIFQLAYLAVDLSEGILP